MNIAGYGSIMKTLLALVKLRPTPPARSEMSRTVGAGVEGEAQWPRRPVPLFWLSLRKQRALPTMTSSISKMIPLERVVGRSGPGTR
jgi:hypothetical protein